MKNLIVGVDGADPAAHALEWAVRTVGRDGAIHAVTAATPLPDVAVDAGALDEGPLLERITRRLESDWVATLGERVGELSARADAAPAAEALRRHAIERTADAIVLGTHTPRLGAPRKIGRTLRHLLRDLPCPLVVVPSENSSNIDDGDPVVVGIGHGDATECAVRWAADLAADHDLPLGLVRATGEGPVFSVEGLIDLVTYYIDPSQRHVWAREDVAEMARIAQEATAEEIEIGVSTVTGLPSQQLVELSGRACLLVIGQHHGLVADDHHVAQPLGHALTHAKCPVVVVPTDAGDVDQIDQEETASPSA